MLSVTQKRCPKCGEWKGVQDFSNDKSNKDGLCAYCRTCNRQKATAYDMANADKVSLRRKVRYQENRGEVSAQRRQFYKQNDERIKKRRKILRSENKDRERHYNLMEKFGITLEQYNKMLEAQGGVCAICGKPETAKAQGSNNTRQLSVDHDHQSGEIRALLCSKCNTALGLMNDDVNIIQKAFSYLKRFMAE